jgi:hypothetical protein
MNNNNNNNNNSNSNTVSPVDKTPINPFANKKTENQESNNCN